MVHSGLMTILPVAAGAGILHLIIFLLLRSKKKRLLKEPVTTESLRGPGQSLLVRIDRVIGEIKGCYHYLLALPLFIAMAHLIVSAMGQVSESWIRIAFSVGLGSVYVVYYISRLWVLSAKKRIYQHAYNGEVTVAKELNQLMDAGYYVYHDFPADQFNIDHIVIGPKGVMAVETRTRSKAAPRKKQANGVVTYDGRMLHFPKYSDHQIIDQAKRQSVWLSNWLTSAVGEEICARAIVALPGWFVKRTSAEGIPVVNPSQFDTLFKHIKPWPLSDGLVQRIVQQIDRQCRNSSIGGNACYPAPS